MILLFLIISAKVRFLVKFQIVKFLFFFKGQSKKIRYLKEKTPKEDLFFFFIKKEKQIASFFLRVGMLFFTQSPNKLLDARYPHLAHGNIAPNNALHIRLCF